MIADLGKLVIGSYLLPRQTLRGVLNRGFGPQEIALLLVLGYVIAEILSILVPGARLESDGGLDHYVTGLIMTVASMFMFAWPIYGLGRMFGGQGDLMQTCTMYCWFNLVATFIWVPVMPAALEIHAALQKGPPSEEIAQALQGSVSVILVVSAISFWLLVNFVTELHRFQSLIATGAVMLGFMLFFSLFFLAMAGG